MRQLGLTEERQALYYLLGKELTPKACKILILLIGLCDIETGKIETSLADLHERTGVAVSTIRKALDELQQIGVLEVEHKVGISADYRLIFSEKIQNEAIRYHTDKSGGF